MTPEQKLEDRVQLERFALRSAVEMYGASCVSAALSKVPGAPGGQSYLLDRKKAKERIDEAVVELIAAARADERAKVLAEIEENEVVTYRGVPVRMLPAWEEEDTTP